MLRLNNKIQNVRKFKQRNQKRNIKKNHLPGIMFFQPFIQAQAITSCF